MKEMLGHLAEGQVEFYKAVRVSFIPSPPFVDVFLILLRPARQWKNGRELYLLSSGYEWTFNY